MRSFARWSALVLGAVFSLGTFLSPKVGAVQQPSQTSPQPSSGQRTPVLRTTTRLVILDVVAVNEKGDPITDLTADDFTVLEDGKPQKISDFSFHRPGATAAPAQQLAPGVVSNAPQFAAGSCLNVVLLDAINTDFSDHAYAQDMLDKYLESNPSLQPTAVFALEGKLTMLHDFTTDPKVLRDVVAHFKPQGPEHIPDVYTAASPFQRRGSFKAGPHAREVTENAMLFLAHTLASYPGRKNLLWLSDGFPISLFPDFNAGDQVMVVEDYSPMAERIADELMNAQVALYPIDAAGVSVNDRFPAHTAMVSMAERTGGKTFFNRNDIDMGVRTSLDDGATYYTIDYYPQNRVWDKKFRRVELKLNRPKAQLRYRQGYYALNPGSEDGSSVSEALGRAMDRDAPSSAAILFQAGVVPPTSQTQGKTVVNFGIDPHTLTFAKEADDLQHASVRCVVWAYPAKGEPVREEGQSKAALPNDVYQQVMHSYFPCHKGLALKAGRYTLRLGVLDETSNLIGTTTTQVSIP